MDLVYDRLLHHLFDFPIGKIGICKLIFVYIPFCRFAIASHKSYRHILPLTVSLVEMYGVVIFIMTAILEGNNFSSSQYYYYAYFVGANFPWALIPSLIFIRSWKEICEIQRTNKEKVQ